MIAGTLVIDDVECLDKVEQDNLSRWMGVFHFRGAGAGAGARAALSRSFIGRFSASLYYHINTVTVEMRAPADMP